MKKLILMFFLIMAMTQVSASILSFAALNETANASHVKDKKEVNKEKNKSVDEQIAQQSDADRHVALVFFGGIFFLIVVSYAASVIADKMKKKES